MSPTLSGQQDQFGDRQFVVLTSEKQARVVALPSHNCVYRQQLTDVDFVIKAEIISLKGKSDIHIGVVSDVDVTYIMFN
jgi:syntaxin-binding protein 5